MNDGGLPRYTGHDRHQRVPRGRDVHHADRARGGTPIGEPVFEQMLGRHRRELHVHCYPRLGAVPRHQDLVQERSYTLANRGPPWPGGRPAVSGSAGSPRSTYGRHPQPPPSGRRARLLRPRNNNARNADRGTLAGALGQRAAGPDPGAQRQPGDRHRDRETIELTFIAAIQSLPPRQRAVVLLCAGLGWTSRRDGRHPGDDAGRGEQCPAAGPRGAARSPAGGWVELDGRPAHRRRTGHPAPVDRGARAR